MEAKVLVRVMNRMVHTLQPVLEYDGGDDVLRDILERVAVRNERMDW